MADAPAPLDSARSLARGLTLLPAAALIVTNVIGTGIFVKARVMTCNVGSPTLVLVAYALAGIFTLAGALTFAELSTLMPRAGGAYNYLGAAFGRVWAFLYGWVSTFIDGAGSLAAIAIVFAIFFNDLVAGALSAAQSHALTVGILIAMALLNLASVRANGLFATAITALKILLVAGIAGAAFLLSDGTWDHFGMTGAGGTCEGVAAGARFGTAGLSAGLGAAVVGALWSYNGWSIVSFVAEEVREPGRTLPRALVSATVVVIGLYLFINAAYFYVLSPEAVASVPEDASVAGAVLVRLLGAGSAALMAAGLMVSSLGALHSTFLAMARVPFAMARGGLLPRALARLAPRTMVPANAVLLLGVAAIAFALSGTFDVLTDLIIFVLLFFNGLAVASVYVLRRTLPHTDRPYRVWGYPVVPGLYLLATLYLMVNTLLATPGRALAGVGIVALGLPVYWYYARKLPPAQPEDWLTDRGGAPE